MTELLKLGCPMNVDRCKVMFQGYHQPKLNEILDNIEHGIRLHSTIITNNTIDEFYNHKSALLHE